MSPLAITYTLHPASPNPILSAAVAGISAHLPLRNLHWKSPTRTSLRTIQEVDVHLVELGEISSARGQSGSVLDSPLVNICLVVCEDAEVYKNQTRNFLRDWLSLLAARRTPHAPLIVLVNPPHTAEKSGKSVWGKDKGVLGKLKADFNVGKRDRCVQLNLPSPGTNDPAAWPELINKLKESFITAFDTAILEREEEVKRGEAQRVMVGWNFCTWFLLKESLAQSFEAVNLPEDSLIIYEELEASFIQVVKEQNLSWFGKMGATGPNDDSMPILDTTVKPYREMLRDSAISIFDFRVYLFARQGILLGKLGRITEVAKRGQWFVASLAKRLRESEADLAENFIEFWTYTACMDIVSKCDQWSCIDRPNGDYSGLTAYESARAELLDIARIQVERLGVSSGHLPDIYPFQHPSAPLPSRRGSILFEDMSIDSSAPPSPTIPERRPLSNSLLVKIMQDKDKYLDFYGELTDKALMAYEKCGKLGSSIRLKADLSALTLLSQDWNSAYALSRALAKECAELKVWEPVAKFALETALQAHSELGSEKDIDWVNIAISYLRVCAADVQTGTELEEVVEALKSSDIDLEVEEHDAFEVRLLGDETTFDGDEAFVDVEVTNRLALPLCVDSISFDFVNSSGEYISFSAEDIILQPGINPTHLSCPTSTQGVYILQSTTITLGEISFSYRKTGEITKLQVRRGEDGVHVKLRMPFDMKLDDSSKVDVDIRSGKSDMKGVTLTIKSLVGEVRYISDDATRSEVGVLKVDEEGGIEVGDIAAGQNVVVSVAYTGVPPGERAWAHISVHYETDKGAREWIDTQSVNTGLPLTVNVQDFFRPECLLSHFTIASDEKDLLRIISVDLDAPDGSGYSVEGCRQQARDPVVVMPNQPLSCLFKIRRTDGGDPMSVLRLSIRYRNIEEELRTTVSQALRKLSPKTRPMAERTVRQFLADRSKWKAYLYGESLEKILRVALVGVTMDVDDFFEALKGNEEQDWRRLEIPVDVPQRRLLTTVQIVPLTPATNLIYQGRPLAMSIRLSTSSKWIGLPTPLSDEEKSQRLVFDVQVNPEDWVVLGKKKGYFVPDPEKDEEQQVVLLPIRAGTLFLPNVSVQPLDFLPELQQHHSRDQSQNQDVKMACESHVENAAQTITVLPAKREATALIPLAMPMPGAIPVGEGWSQEQNIQNA